MNQASFFCPQCQEQRLFQSQPLNHILYLLVSVLLCGLGFIIWILAAASHKEIWRCSFCGYGSESKYLVNPNLWSLEQNKVKERQVAEVERAKVKAERIASLPRDTTGQKALAFYYTYQFGIIATAIGCIVVGLFGMLIALDSYNSKGRYESASRNSTVSNIDADAAAIRLANTLAANAVNAANRIATTSNLAPNVIPAPTVPERKSSQRKTAEIISENANLRRTADSYSEVVDILPFGATVEVVRQSGPWFLVRYAGTTGWVHGNTIEIVELGGSSR